MGMREELESRTEDNEEARTRFRNEFEDEYNVKINLCPAEYVLWLEGLLIEEGL